MYDYAPSAPARPPIPEATTIFAQRNPIPTFGTGLIAEISEEEILSRADPDDADGDGVSGRPNFERGFVGRFGRKAQTASVEGFIRGPLFNHAGITTQALTDEQRARLPVESSSHQVSDSAPAASGLRPAQAAVLDLELTDDDPAPDPELSREDLFDLVSFTMLLAVGEVERLDETIERGAELFDEVGCGTCHTPRLMGPRGPIPIHSDLLVHDMGIELADGLDQGVATAAEFRTQPLWSIGAVGPYLHDGRADSLEVRLHGGEAAKSRDALLAQGPEAMVDVVELLLSLGGRDQTSPGLLPPGSPVPPVGEYGGPASPLDERELARFVAGRAFDSGSCRLRRSSSRSLELEARCSRP
jgi:CxxC motif-containing protein (DUF1111 family)